MRRPAILAAAAALCLATLTVPAASAAPRAPAAALAGRALDWAEANATGRPYVYGAAGPGGYDCSGLVMAAYAAADGITLPHNTEAMLASGQLTQVPIGQAPRGALLFFGPGHVELKTIWPSTSFGALDTGTLIGWHAYGGSWQPTAAYIVTGG